MCLTSLTNLTTQVDFHPIGRKIKTDFPRFAESARFVFATRSHWFIEVAVFVLIGQFHDSHYNTSFLGRLTRKGYAKWPLALSSNHGPPKQLPPFFFPRPLQIIHGFSVPNFMM